MTIFAKSVGMQNDSYADKKRKLFIRIPDRKNVLHNIAEPEI